MENEKFIEREKQDSEKDHDDHEMEKFKLYLTEIKTFVLAHESTEASNLQ
ncbi:MAG: hypothetical protein ACXACI_08595 [Candidatus Hodarchaeales archaeon]|jgi:hypothetical protein